MLSLKPTSSEISPYGMIGTMQLTYLLGVSLLVVALCLSNFSGNRGSPFTWIQFIILLAYLWYLPVLIYPVLPFPASNHDFVFFPAWYSVIANGHLDFSTYGVFFQPYPASYLLMATLLVVLHLDNYVSVFQLTPFLLNLLSSLFLYAFFKSAFGDNHSKFVFPALALFQLLNFSGILAVYTFFSIGYLYYYIVLGLLSVTGFFAGKISSIGRRAWLLLMPVVISLELTHPEIPIAVMAMMMVVGLGSRVRKTPIANYQLRLAYLSGVIFLAWAIFAAYILNASIIPVFFQSLTQGILVFFRSAIPGQVSVTSSHILTDYVKIFTVFGVGILAIPALVKIISNRHMLWIFFSMLGLALEALTVGNIQGYSFVIRILAYTLPFLVFLDIYSIILLVGKSSAPTNPVKVKRTGYLVVALLIILAPVFYVNNYSNLQSDLIPSAVISASAYFTSHVPPLDSPFAGFVYSFQPINDFGSNLHALSPYYSSGISGAFGNYGLQNSTSLFSLRELSKSEYFVIGENTLQQADFYGGTQLRALVISATSRANSVYPLVYSDNEVTIYYPGNG